MKKYDIFASEGGYRLCLGVWNDGPILDSSPWFEEKDEAEKAKEAALREKEKFTRIEILIAARDIDALNALKKED